MISVRCILIFNAIMILILNCLDVGSDEKMMRKKGGGCDVASLKPANSIFYFFIIQS